MRTTLRDRRKVCGLTVAEIAEKTRISRSFYYKIEAGVRNPTMATAKEIADLLGQTVDGLFFGEILDDSSSNEEPKHELAN